MDGSIYQVKAFIGALLTAKPMASGIDEPGPDDEVVAIEARRCV